MAKTSFNLFLIYVARGSLDALKNQYSLTWQLVTNALTRDAKIVDGYGVTGVVLNNDSGPIIAVSRV